MITNDCETNPKRPLQTAPKQPRTSQKDIAAAPELSSCCLECQDEWLEGVGEVGHVKERSGMIQNDP